MDETVNRVASMRKRIEFIKEEERTLSYEVEAKLDELEEVRDRLARAQSEIIELLNK